MQTHDQTRRSPSTQKHLQPHRSTYPHASTIMESKHPTPMVTTLFEREADAVEGAFYVAKGECILCDLPSYLAPLCIKTKLGSCTDEQYCHIYKQPETSEELDTVIEAMEGSCVQAIRYCGTDIAILKKLISHDLAHLCDAKELIDSL
eukprot:Seg24814.1 transcript_id=Seg24814.1/GoldUCD/mRNA.D3Y31 product="hypothetical protein" protein_id=Seg24814.1/GoldUCD/D3Y31